MSIIQVEKRRRWISSSYSNLRPRLLNNVEYDRDVFTELGPGEGGNALEIGASTMAQSASLDPDFLTKEFEF